MGPITTNLYNQIKGWRIYSIIAPAAFAATSALAYIFYGAQFETIFYCGLILLALTCIAWWHWALSTMVTMLAIMKDTDDHFETVTHELERLRTAIKPDLRVVKTIDFQE